jgi:hypothetical protein
MSAAIPSVAFEGQKSLLNFPELTLILERTANAFAPWTVS